MFKSVFLYPTLIVSALARLNAPERNLGWWSKADPYCAVITGSTGDSKISWRLFVKDNTPELQDDDEQTIDVMHYLHEGKTKLEKRPLVKGVDYCLRIYKGESNAYGSGTSEVKVSCFNEDENETTLASISMSGPTGQAHKQDITCFRA